MVFNDGNACQSAVNPISSSLGLGLKCSARVTPPLYVNSERGTLGRLDAIFRCASGNDVEVHSPFVGIGPLADHEVGPIPVTVLSQRRDLDSILVPEVLFSRHDVPTRQIIQPLH